MCRCISIKKTIQKKHSCKTLWLFLLPNIYRTAGERESIFFNMIKTFKGAGFKISNIDMQFSSLHDPVIRDYRPFSSSYNLINLIPL